MKTYIRLSAIALALCLCQRIQAQSVTECEKIVHETIHAINIRSAESLHAYLAPDFECSGQTGNIAKLVLNQIAGQLNDNISEFKKISESKDEEGLTLVYQFTYSRIGERTATFVFDKENRIKRLDLFTVMVKKADSDFKIEKPKAKAITVPIEVTADNLIVVSATINGEECKFIIDSGAPSLYLNSKYFLENGKGKAISTINTSKDIKVMMSDLSHLENGMEIHGLIGYSIYKDYDLLFDYRNKTLTLINPDYTDTFLNENGCKYIEESLYFNNEKTLSHIPCVKARIDNTEFLMGIDCGAGTNLLDAGLWEALKRNLKNVGTTDLKGANNGTAAEVHEGKLKSMKIGRKTFRNTNTVFSNIDHLNSERTEAIQGIIGYEILSRQKTVLCYKKKRMLFIK